MRSLNSLERQLRKIEARLPPPRKEKPIHPDVIAFIAAWSACTKGLVTFDVAARRFVDIRFETFEAACEHFWGAPHVGWGGKTTPPAFDSAVARRIATLAVGYAREAGDCALRDGCGGPTGCSEEYARHLSHRYHGQNALCAAMTDALVGMLSNPKTLHPDPRIRELSELLLPRYPNVSLDGERMHPKRPDQWQGEKQGMAQDAPTTRPK